MTITEATKQLREIFPDRKISTVEGILIDPLRIHTARTVKATVFRKPPSLLVESQFRGLSWDVILQDARQYAKPIEIGVAR